MVKNIRMPEARLERTRRAYAFGEDRWRPPHVNAAEQLQARADEGPCSHANQFYSITRRTWVCRCGWTEADNSPRTPGWNVIEGEHAGLVGDAAGMNESS